MTGRLSTHPRAVPPAAFDLGDRVGLLRPIEVLRRCQGSPQLWQTCEIPRERPQNGIDFLKYAHDKGFARPTVFFIGNLKNTGAPAYSVGITNDWWEALHLVLDALSRDHRFWPE
jgi:hypothetical protein